MPVLLLSDTDIVILDHAQLDAFVSLLGDPAAHDHLTLLTDDDMTRGTIKFNLVEHHDGALGVVTQLHDPVATDDAVIDLRTAPERDFSDYLCGLA